MKEYNKPRRS